MLNRITENWDLCLLFLVAGGILTTCAKALAMWLTAIDSEDEYNYESEFDYHNKP